jgi:hypothetical protein
MTHFVRQHEEGISKHEFHELLFSWAAFFQRG